MEVYTNIILTLIFMCLFFLVMFINRNTSSINKLSEKIDKIILNVNNDDNTFNFYKLQIEELKESLNNLSIKIKHYDTKH